MSLLYYDYQISTAEIPGESSLLVFLAACPFHCEHCSSPWLHENVGEDLIDRLPNLISSYGQRMTCVCFMGEGSGTNEDHDELIDWSNDIHHHGLKVALYTGRNGDPTDWMTCFDFVKLGSFQEEAGSLEQTTTNQRLFEKTSSGWLDITYKFWN